MTPKIPENIRQALHHQQGKPLEVEDAKHSRMNRRLPTEPSILHFPPGPVASPKRFIEPSDFKIIGGHAIGT